MINLLHKGVLGFVWIWIVQLSMGQTFKEDQLTFERVKKADELKGALIDSLLSEKEITGEFDLFIRAFKKENELEVWAKGSNYQEFVLLKTYPFCQRGFMQSTMGGTSRDPEIVSGSLGPKRRQGDGQIPEGVYFINHFNPWSSFHLSLGLNYPNRSDRILTNAEDPGGDIYIHGDCSTVGCIPITDDKIKEVYLLAIEARSGGQERIPVHIFPMRLSEGNLEYLEDRFSDDLEVIAFWQNLQPVYKDFEADRQLPKVSIDSKGKYKVE